MRAEQANVRDRDGRRPVRLANLLTAGTNLRFPVAAGVACLVTFALFWTMQALVGVSGKLKESEARTSVDFVRLRKDTTPPPKKREAPKRQKPEQTPPPPQMNMAKNLKPGDAVGEIVPMVDTAAELGKATSLGAGSSDRDVVPLVRVDPDYPPRALQRRIEGYVDLEFSIGPAGTVQGARVIGANPPAVFDRAALRAVSRWRYNPQIEEGTPVTREGVRVRLTFRLAGR